MSKYPLQPSTRRGAARTLDSREVIDVESREVAPTAPRAVAPADPQPSFGGFFSFHYTRTEISSQGGRTHVRTRTASLQDGRLTSESFEGELDARAHVDAVRAAEREVLEQAARLLNPFSWLLRSRGDRWRR
jgi:hypothetical protein